MDFEILSAEALAALDDDALQAYMDAALAAAQALDSDPDADLPVEALDQIEAIIASRTQAGQIQDERATEQEALAQRRAAARAALDSPEDGDDGENDSGDDQVDPHVDEAGDADADADAEAGALVAAGARPSAVVRAGRRQAKPPAPKAKAKPRASITASADLPGVATMGSTIASIEALAPGATDVIRTLARGRQGSRNERPIASFTMARTDGLSQAETQNDQDLMYLASSEFRLEGKSLVAAGGWCAPSETLYDLCGQESLDGLWDVPTIQVNRGGVNFTKGPQFADFYASASISQTEAQAEAGTEKECVEITCPDFTEVRLDVVGVCISVPILTNAAYPELVQRWISGTLIAHEHRKSVALITKALAIAGAAVTVANPFPSATASILAALELVIQGERQRYRLSLSETLEVVFPFWVKGVIRTDLSMRTGVDMFGVTDQMIESWFSLRGARAQYVYGWQPLVGTSAGAGPVITYPTPLEILVYPAGTFVAGTKDVITLNGVYDSVGLSTNTYTALFTEEGTSLMNMCHEPRRLSLALEINGITAGAFSNQNWGVAEGTLAVPLASFTDVTA